MTDGGRVTRRDILRLLGASGVGVSAGCNPGDRASTDTSAGTTRGTSPESRTPPRTDSGETFVFDGGGTAAFSRALDRLAAHPGATLEIESGTYQLDPATGAESVLHFDRAGFETATISGNGATLEFTDTTRGMIRITDSSGLTIEDLTLDYAERTFTQGVVRSRSTADHSVVVDLDEGYPTLDHEMFYDDSEIMATVHEPDGRFVEGVRKTGSLDKLVAAVDHLSGRRYELHLEDWSTLRGIRPGRRLAIYTRGRRYWGAHGLLVRRVDGVAVRDVTLHDTRAFALFVVECADPTIRGVTVRPPPDSDRLLGGIADGIHVANCPDGPTVEDCHVQRIGDDGIVVVTWLSEVDAIPDERTVAVSQVHPHRVEAGDVLAAMSPDGRRKGELPPVAAVSRSDGSRGVSRITFERPVAGTLAPDDYLQNRARSNRDYAVRNNVVRNVRARLVRLGSGHGVVENNVFDGSSNPALLCQCYTGTQWGPVGWIDDLTVRNNEIRRSGMNYFGHTRDKVAGIDLEHQSAPSVLADGQPHRDIEIRDNAFANTAHLALDCADVDGLTVAGNEFSELCQLDYPHPFEETGYALGFENATDVRVTANDVSGTADHLSRFGWHRDSSVTASDNEFTVDGESRAPEFVTVASMDLVFDRTVQPSERGASTDSRELAIYCTRISFLDEGTTVSTVDVGGEEAGVAFDAGAFGRVPAGVDSDSGRWFGGPAGVMTLSARQSVVDGATAVSFRARPVVEGVDARVRFGGRTTDRISFDAASLQTYTASLEPS